MHIFGIQEGRGDLDDPRGLAMGLVTLITTYNPQAEAFCKVVLFRWDM